MEKDITYFVGMTTVWLFKNILSPIIIAVVTAIIIKRFSSRERNIKK
ncbi:MAG: hypothetical protein ACM3UU_00630 [Ignavibacteriales bacterium]